jgi:coatomer subunit beta
LFCSPDIEVRRKAIRIALEMVSSRNVQEVVLFLKKELGKTQDDSYEKVIIIYTNEYSIYQ